MADDPYAKFGGAVDPYAQFGGAVTTAPVPGMEKLGGAVPGPPKVALPGEMDPNYATPSTFQNPRTGRIGTNVAPGRADPLTNYFDKPVTGGQRMAQGVDQMSNPHPKPGNTPGTSNPPSAADQIAGGASKVIRGGMEAASPLLPVAAAAAPIATLAGLATGGAAGATAGAGLRAMGAPEGVADLGEDVAGIAAGGLAAKRAPTVAGVRERFSRDPKDLMTRGIKPAATNTNFATNLDRSLPELKATEAELGRPIENLADLQEGIQAAKKRVWGQYRGVRDQPTIDPYTKQPIAGASPGEAHVDMSPVADAMEATVSSKLRRENPKAAQAIADLAAKYRTQVPFQEAEDILKTTNGELEGYYAKYPPAQRALLTRSAGSGNPVPRIAMKEAQASAIRDLLYEHLDAAGEGAAPREFKQRYGSLMNLEREVYRRKNVADRQQPDSLSEQFGKWSAAGKVVKGVLTGNPAEALQGVAESRMAKWLKEQQATDALIKSAMANYKGMPGAVDAPAAFAPKALLAGPNGHWEDTPGRQPQRYQSGGTMYTPPPVDTSGVSVADVAPHQQVNRMRKALPAGTAPFTQGVVVPEIKGRDATGHQYLLEGPKPGQPPVNILPRGPASVQGPAYEPSDRGRPRPLGPETPAALMTQIEALKAENARLKGQGPPPVQLPQQ